jgi:dihydroorotate dehydrogenase
MYKYLTRPILFKLNAEKAHSFVLRLLDMAKHIPFARRLIRMVYKRNFSSLHRELFGIDFPNPVGLAAGMDKNGEHYNSFQDFGFGFVEIGSLTPEPQAGNPKPRLFRIPKDKAIVNHMGINNKGIQYAIRHIQKEPPTVILAASLAKGSNSKNDDAIINDYVTSFSLMYDFADMFVINISCPNVDGMLALEDPSFLADVMDELIRQRLCYEKYKPLLIKISPDIPHAQLNEILDYCMLSRVDGIVAGNTAKTKDGGLSGAPLFEKSMSLVSYIHQYTKGRLPIVGCGGIMTPQQAKMMLDAGASLIEIYTGFIYNGPSFVKHILKYLDRSRQQS